MTADDFIDEVHARIYRAMTAVAVRDEDITTVATWHEDHGLDVVELCNIENEFACDPQTRSWLADVHGTEVLVRSRRRRELVAA